MDDDSIRSAVLEAIEASLAAQLKAVRALRAGMTSPAARSTHSGEPPRKKGRSQIDMTHAILLEAGGPLHVSDIIDRISARFNVHVDRESLVSALSKRVRRQDRFVRTARNTFALIAEPADRPRPHE